MWDEEWLPGIISNHIVEYYRAHASLPPFNVIYTTHEGTPTTFESKPDDIIARPIKEHLYYIPGPNNPIPTTSFDQLVDKVFLGRAVDRCLWQGRDCVFKRVEFDCDVKLLDREITVREKLMATMNLNLEDSWHALDQRFSVMPILAVVLKQGSDNDNDVLGILMPFGGPALNRYYYHQLQNPDD